MNVSLDLAAINNLNIFSHFIHMYILFTYKQIMQVSPEGHCTYTIDV